jgi:hypothetical protein
MYHNADLFFAFILAFAVGELVAWGIFFLIRKWLAPAQIHNGFSMLKGLIERLMLYIGFVANIPTVIVFFGAIKIGTRLKEINNEKISNDYFLVGNAVSAIIAISEFIAFKLILHKI